MKNDDHVERQVDLDPLTLVSLIRACRDIRDGYLRARRGAATPGAAHDFEDTVPASREPPWCIDVSVGD